jgi:hypothetical protein
MYDLTIFDRIFADILSKGKPGSYELGLIKQELNKFYHGNNICKDVIYTLNTDKAFFGMKVYLNLTPTTVANTFTLKENNNTQNNYVIEFDSKLFDELNGFTARELTTILMHEVGHIAQNDKANSEIIKDSIIEYQTKNRTNTTTLDVHKCVKLFDYALRHTIESIQSIFQKDQEEFEADRFSIEMGYGPDLESAFTKILKARGTFRPQGKLNTLFWTLTVYKQIFERRKFITRCMDDINQYSGSKLEKQDNKELKDSLIKSFKQPINETYIRESALNYIVESVFRGLKRSGLKAIEDDTYVYQIKIKNVDNEIEAMDIMRDINSKINIVSDYLSLEKGLSESEIKRWGMLLSKLEELRDSLAKSDSYKPKYLGLWTVLPTTQRRY